VRHTVRRARATPPGMTAKYRMVADRIRVDILSGTLQPGAQLPTTRQLAAEHGEATGIIAAAIKWLATEGWVRAEHGVGIFVVDTPPAGSPTLAELAARITELEQWRRQIEGRADD